MSFKLDNMVVSFVLFATLVTLLITAYNGLEENYGIIKTDVNEDNESIMEELNNLTIIQSINGTITGVYALENPTSNILDVLGALATAGIGVVKIVTSIISLPIEIIGIITGFYYIPPMVSIAIGIIFLVAKPYL